MTCAASEAGSVVQDATTGMWVAEIRYGSYERKSVKATEAQANEKLAEFREIAGVKTGKAKAAEAKSEKAVETSPADPATPAT